MFPGNTYTTPESSLFLSDKRRNKHLTGSEQSRHQHHIYILRVRRADANMETPESIHGVDGDSVTNHSDIHLYSLSGLTKKLCNVRMREEAGNK